jgi:CHAD domain-containing protein
MTLTFDPTALRNTLRTPSAPPSSAPLAARRRSAGLSLRDQPVADAFVVLTTPLASEAFFQTEQMAERGDAGMLDNLRATFERLRALWWAFEPLLDEKEARVVRKRFKRLAEIAGEPHELEAACDLLMRARKTCSRVGPVVRTLKQERREASAASCLSIREANIDRLLRRALADARRRLEARIEACTLEEFARQRVSLADETLSKKEQRATRMKHIDAKTLRSIDEAANKLQCLLELFAPVLEREYRHAVEHLAEAQAALGHLGDVLASEAVVRRVATSLDDKHAVDQAVRWLDKERRGQSRVAMKRLRAMTYES